MTFGWLWSYDQQIKFARHPEAYAPAGTPVVMLAPLGDKLATDACRALPACTYSPSQAAHPHLARDKERSAWLASITAQGERR